MPRNYHFSRMTFVQGVRIASRLAVRTGVCRLVWLSVKGRVHITHEGEGGYHHSSEGIVGQRPTHASVDWQNGGLCEAGRTFPPPEELETL